MIVVIDSINYGDPLQHIDDVTVGVKYLSDHPEKVSLVMFTGGEDVHPSFYNGVDKGISYTNIKRDMYEKKVFDLCTHHDTKRLGICRGAQFLNVMCGGFMYQHIENHTSYHNAYFPYDDAVRKVTSTHHQLIGLPSGAVPIAWAAPKRSDVYIGPNCEKVGPPKYEIEAAIYPRFNTLGVQFHPEMMAPNEPGRILFIKMVKDFLENSIETFTDLYGAKNNVVHNNLLAEDICRISVS